jgi:ABC-type multidrug transport system fused ATPase/permease subunit
MSILVFVSAIIELISIAILGKFISLLLSDFSLVDINTILNKFRINLEIKSKNRLLVFGGVLLLFIYTLKTIYFVYFNKVITEFAENVRFDLQLRLFKRYQQITYLDFIQHSSGYYTNNIIQLTNNFTNQILLPMLRMVSDFLIVLLIFAYVSFFSPLSILLLVVICFIFLITYDKIFRKKLKQFGTLSGKASEKILNSIYENYVGYKSIIVYEKQHFFYEKFRQIASIYKKNNLKAQVIVGIPKNLIEFIMILFIVSLVFGSLLLNVNSAIIFSTLSILAISSIRVIPAINNVSSLTNQLRHYGHAVKILATALKNDENLILDSELSEVIRGSKFRSFEIKNFSFLYKGQNNLLFNNLNLEIKRGDRIGIIGPSGVGKSTLLDLILGMLSSKNNLFVNGIDINKAKLFWNSKLAYLPQTPFLINGTILENITLGETEVDYDKISKSLKFSRLEDFVNNTTENLNTQIGESGGNLSGGQRQRIALARAFYFDKEVIVLDESTSALDKKLENEIISDLYLFDIEKTLIIVTHNLNTLYGCNKIFELTEGKLKIKE